MDDAQLIDRDVSDAISEHWRNLTARKMPWRPKAGEPLPPIRGVQYAGRYAPDPLGDPPRPPAWKVPGPLGAVLRLGTEEFQAIGMDGRWVLCVCASDGHITRMDKVTYEIAVGVRRPPEPRPCLISVQVDGEQVPLDQCDWVLYSPCGCPEGVHLAATGQKVYAADEDAAWQSMFDTKRERDRAQRQGCRMELMTHERYRAEVAPMMTARCPHQPEPAGQMDLPEVAQ